MGISNQTVQETVGKEDTSPVLGNGTTPDTPVAAGTCSGTCDHGFACIRTAGHWGKCKCSMCYQND